jgi:hypothetical protein
MHHWWTALGHGGHELFVAGLEMFQVLSDTVDVVCASHSSYVAHNPVPKNLLRASHLELPDCSCPAKRSRSITWFFSVKMSDVLMCDFYQGPGYSFCLY